MFGNGTLEMGFGNGIWKWDLDMGFGNGIWKWDLEMGFGNGTSVPSNKKEWWDSCALALSLRKSHFRKAEKCSLRPTSEI